MAPLGTKAPDFALTDVVSGEIVALSSFRGGTGLLVMFICRHCPFVKHLEQGLAGLGRDYAGRLPIVGISSNDAETYPDDAPESLKQQASQAGFRFPYLYDATQDVARAFGAACTPDFFLYDGNMRLVYRGQFDGSRPGNNVPVTGSDLRAALDALLAGEPIRADQRASLGCNIKWRRAAA